MIVMKENERLYLRSWEYNAARTITELAAIVKLGRKYGLLREFAENGII